MKTMNVLSTKLKEKSKNFFLKIIHYPFECIKPLKFQYKLDQTIGDQLMKC